MKKVNWWLVCMCMILGAFWLLGSAPQVRADTCTGLSTCNADEHDSGCAAMDQAAADAVWEQYTQLPTLDVLMTLPTEEQSAAIVAVNAVYDAYEALTDAQKALLPPAQDLFGDYFTYFSGQTATAATLSSGSCGTSLRYTLSDTGTLTISGSGEMTSNPWLSYSSSVKKITMSGGTTICENAFGGCTNLTSVSLPSTLTSIGEEAFYNCKSLTTLTIPSKVTQIAETAFMKCAALTQLKVSSSNTAFKAENGFLFTKDGTALLLAPAGLTEAYTVAEGITSIGGYAFYNAPKLSGITFPSSLRSIGSHAFYENSAITSVTFPASLQSIGDYAFYYVKNLGGNLVIPDTVTSLGSYAFSGCDYITSAKLPKYLSTVPEYLFFSCDSLQQVTMPQSPTEIGNYAFWDCAKLSSITLASTITRIGNNAFYGCDALTSVSLPQSLQTVGSYAFAYCIGLNSVTIPNGVTDIGDYAFRGCTALSAITLSENLQTIGYSAFYGCSGLTEITIPKNVTSIGGACFDSCRALTKIVFCGDAPIFGNYAFDYVSATAYYPVTKAGWQELLASSQPLGGIFQWTPYMGQAHDHTFVNSKCSCGAQGGTNWLFDSSNGTLYYHAKGAMTDYNSSSYVPWYNLRSSIRHVVVCKGVTTVGKNAFASCSNLETVSLPLSGLTSIGDYAFYSCGKLKNIQMPDTGVTNIGSYAFAYSYALEEFDMPASYVVIGSNAFYYSGIREILLTYVRSIGNYAFSGSDLTDLYYGSTQTSWNNLGYTLPSNVRIHYSCTDPSNHWTLTNTGDTCITGGYVSETCKCTSTQTRRKALPTPTDSTLHNWYGSKCTVCGITGGTCGASCYWSLDPTGKLLISGTGAMKSVSSERNVPWYSSRTKITTVVVEEGITVLCYSAFQSAENLTRISLPSTLETIGSYAFASAYNLERIDIPSLADYLEMSFGTAASCPTYTGGTLYVGGQPLVDIVIPDGITEIPDYAFYGYRNMVSLTLPQGLEQIGSYAFQYCTGLTELYIPGSASINYQSFASCTGLQHVVIGEGVTAIGDYAFSSCTGLKSLVLPASVTQFGTNCFYGNAVCHLIFTGTQTQFNAIKYASGGTKYFTATSVIKHFGADPASVQMRYLCTETSCYCTLCDSNAFSTAIEGGVHTYDGYTCTVCGYVADMNSGSCGDSVQWTLSGTGTLTVTGTGAMTDYAEGEAPWCKDYADVILKVVIENGVSTVGSYAFSGCTALTEVEFADSVTALGEGAFRGCAGLISIAFPESITAIGNSAFSGCTGLRYLQLPASLETVGDSAFSGCGKLWHVLFTGTQSQKDALTIGSSNTALTGATWHCEQTNQAITAPGTLTCTHKVLHKCSVCDGEFTEKLAQNTHKWVAGNCTTPKTCSKCFATEGDILPGVHEFGENGCIRCGAALSELESQWPYAGRSFKLYQDGYYASVDRDTAISSHYWLHAWQSGADTIYLSPNMSHPGQYYAYTYYDGVKLYLCYGSGYVALSTYASYDEWQVLDTWDGKSGPFLAYDLGYGPHVPSRDTEGNLVWHLVESGDAARMSFTSSHKTHTYQESVIAPTCKAEGYTLHQCSCGLSYKTDEQKKRPHLFDTEFTWAADYASASARCICTTCAHSEVLEAEITRTVLTQVTCTTDGSVRIWAKVYPSQGGSIGQSKLQTIPAIGHAYGEDGFCGNCGQNEDPCYEGHAWSDWQTVTEADCENDGLEVRSCTRTDCDATEEQDIEALGHDHKAVVTPPTCEEGGYTTHTCHCGDSYTDSETDPLDHAFGDWQTVTEPDCENDGLERRVCRRDGCEETEENVIPANGHDHKAVVTPPTCEEGGYTTHTCHCGDSYTDSETDPLDHAFGDWQTVTEPDCENDGLERRVCRRDGCEETEENVIPANGHDHKAVVTPPTCEEGGYTTHTCHCGDSYTDTFTTSAGHSWDAGTIVREHSDSLCALKIFLCSNCSEMTETEISIPAPATLSLSNVTTGIKVTWSGVESAVAYRVLRQESDGSWKTIAHTASTTYTDGDILSGGKYFYRIQCVDENSFAISAAGISKGKTFYNRPEFTDIENTPEGIRITWGAVTGAAQYQVFVRTGDGDWVQVGTTTGTSFVYTEAQSAVKYYFTVRAASASGQTRSGYHSVGTGITFFAAPQVKSVANNSAGIKVTWNRVTGAKQYLVFVKKGSDSWQQVATTDQASYTYKDAESGNNYYFSIVAASASGQTRSGMQEGKSITFYAQPVLSISNGENGVTVSWKAVPGAAKYHIFLQNSDGEWVQIDTVRTNSYTHSAAISGQRYTFTVRAASESELTVSTYNSVGKNIVFLARPQLSKITNTAEGVKLTWQRVAGGNRYHVYVKEGNGSWEKVAETTASSYTYTEAISGKKYYMRVCASSESGLTVSAMDAEGLSIAFYDQPEITLLESTADGIMIQWDAVGGAKQYFVYLKTDSGWKKMVAVEDNQYLYTTGANGKAYCFSVRTASASGQTLSAYDTDGWSIVCSK